MKKILLSLIVFGFCTLMASNEQVNEPSNNNPHKMHNVEHYAIDLNDPPSTIGTPNDSCKKLSTAIASLTLPASIVMHALSAWYLFGDRNIISDSAAKQADLAAIVGNIMSASIVLFMSPALYFDGCKTFSALSLKHIYPLSWFLSWIPAAVSMSIQNNSTIGMTREIQMAFGLSLCAIVPEILFVWTSYIYAGKMNIKISIETIEDNFGFKSN
jgi:hypothetical protein